MSPRSLRAPLSDLTNSTQNTGDPTFRSAPKPISAKSVISQQAPPSSSAEPLSHGGGPEAAGATAQVCRTPSSTASMAMEVDPCFSTPRAMEPDDPSLSSKEGCFSIYSRRKVAAPSHLTLSCPPAHHHLEERNALELSSRRKAVKRGFFAAIVSEGGNSKAAPSKSRRHSLPNMHPKRWLPEDFVAAQRSHFAEVDAFNLLEEEGELSDED